LQAQGKDISEMDLASLEAAWQQTKQTLNKPS
jgi:hypothetical protein